MLRLSHSVRKRFARLRSFPQIERRGDSVFILDPGNWIDNRMLAKVPFEDNQIAHVRSRIDALGIRKVFDIGANFGLYTVVFGLLPAIESVTAFEPVARNYNQLCGNIFANRLDKKVVAHKLGLGSEAAAVTIHIDPRSTGVSRLDLSTAARDTSVFTETETINIVKGDDVLPVADERIFAKIDVEGHASAVLGGLPRFLSSNTGLLQIEVDDNDATIAEALEQHGWAFVHRIGGDDYFERNT